MKLRNKQLDKCQDAYSLVLYLYQYFSILRLEDLLSVFSYFPIALFVQMIDFWVFYT